MTGAGGAKSDIAADGVVEFDIGYCFENAEPVEFYLSTWPQAQLVQFAGRLEVSVRFIEEATSVAHTGSYRFAQDSPKSSVWVDSEKGLTSQHVQALKGR